MLSAAAEYIVCRYRRSTKAATVAMLLQQRQLLHQRKIYKIHLKLMEYKTKTKDSQSGLMWFEMLKIQRQKLLSMIHEYRKFSIQKHRMRGEKWAGKTPEEASVLFQATLALTTASWGWADDWEHQSNHVCDGCRDHPELLATNLIRLSEALISVCNVFPRAWLLLRRCCLSNSTSRTIVNSLGRQGLCSVNQMSYRWFELIHLL